MTGFTIGTVNIPGPLLLAPLEGVNCSSFRLLCQKKGADLVYTQMIDADDVVVFAQDNDAKAVRKRFVNRLREEKILVVQIGGSNIENLQKTIELLLPDADIIDYNMGCPLGSMVGKKGGAYLSKHPQRLEKIIPALKQACGAVPLTCKIRLGWEDNNAVEVATQLERLGIAAIAVHGRTRQQRYMDKADWYAIRRVKLALSIPVIANGDVLKPYHAITAIGQTKADAIMIGRAAMDNPLIFTQVKQLMNKLTTDPNPPPLLLDDQYAVVIEWLDLYKRHEARYKISEIQDHVGWMTKGWPNATKLRELVREAKEEKDIRSILGMWKANFPKNGVVSAKKLNKEDERLVSG